MSGIIMISVYPVMLLFIIGVPIFVGWLLGYHSKKRKRVSYQFFILLYSAVIVVIGIYWGPRYYHYLKVNRQMVSFNQEGIASAKFMPNITGNYDITIKINNSDVNNNFYSCFVLNMKISVPERITKQFCASDLLHQPITLAINNRVRNIDHLGYKSLDPR